MHIYKNIRIDHLCCSFKEMHPFMDGLKNQAAAIAPISYAATGNDGLAAASLTLQPSPPAGKAKGWFIQIQSGSSIYKGWITGIFFKEGQTVDLICKGDRKVYAVYSPKQQLIAMHPGILNGRQIVFRGCIKVFKWICVFFSFLLSLILLIMNLRSTAPLSAFLIQIPFIVIGVAGVSALLVWASSRKELKSGWLGTKIFSLLNFSDPASLMLTTVNRIRKMEGAEGYFFSTNWLTDSNKML